MDTTAAILNPYEKEVLFHSLYENEPELRKIIEKIIDQFEKTDFKKKIKVGKKNKKYIELFVDDEETLFPVLKQFYKNGCGYNKKLDKRYLLEAGIFYTIGNLLLIKCHYSKGMNKIMYAATLPNLPERFTPLYLFRIGVIHLEQGMIMDVSGDLKIL